MKSELNSRQWALYNLLRSNPDKYLKQIDIAYRLKEFYDCSFEDDQFHNSATRHLITCDIRAINKSSVIQKIIISNAKGVKIASREEFEEYIESEYALIFRKLKRAHQKAYKAGLDGQMRIAFNQERDTIEAFSDMLKGNKRGAKK